MGTGYLAPMSVFFTYSSSFSSDLSCPLVPAEAVFPVPSRVMRKFNLQTLAE